MRLPRLLAFGSSLFLLGSACNAGSASSPDGGDLDLSFFTEPDLRVRRDMAVARATVTGKVVDEAGDTLDGVPVLACSKSDCIYGKAGAAGVFRIGGVKLGTLLVKTTEDATAVPRRGEGVAPTILDTQDEEVDVGTIHAPTMGAGADFSPTAMTAETLEVGDGVRLTLRRAKIEAPLGLLNADGAPLEADDPLNVAARLVPAQRRPTFDIPGETVIATVAVMPFGSKALDGQKIGVTVPVSGVAEGSEVFVRAIDELEGSLAAPAKAKVDIGGATATTEPGEGIATLSWIVVSKK